MPKFENPVPVSGERSEGFNPRMFSGSCSINDVPRWLHIGKTGFVQVCKAYFKAVLFPLLVSS